MDRGEIDESDVCVGELLTKGRARENQKNSRCEKERIRIIKNYTCMCIHPSARDSCISLLYPIMLWMFVRLRCEDKCCCEESRCWNTVVFPLLFWFSFFFLFLFLSSSLTTALSFFLFSSFFYQLPLLYFFLLHFLLPWLGLVLSWSHLASLAISCIS